MSIKPIYVDGFLGGQKRVEFRRTVPSRNVTHLVVYTTGPVSAVTCVAKVARMTMGQPHELWNSYAAVGGIDRGSFFEYYEGAKIGVAFELEEVWPTRAPIPLGKCGLPKRPPQSFMYLDKATLGRVVARI